MHNGGQGIPLLFASEPGFKMSFWMKNKDVWNSELTGLYTIHIYGYISIEA